MTISSFQRTSLSIAGIRVQLRYHCGIRPRAARDLSPSMCKWSMHTQNKRRSMFTFFTCWREARCSPKSNALCVCQDVRGFSYDLSQFQISISEVRLFLRDHATVAQFGKRRLFEWDHCCARACARRCLSLFDEDPQANRLHKIKM